MVRFQTPGLPLRGRFQRLESGHVEPTVNNMNFLMVPEYGWTVMPLGIIRFRIGVTLTQNLSHELGDGHEGIALAQKESPADP